MDTDRKGEWAVGQSMGLELDFALNVIRSYFLIGVLPKELATLVQSIPEAWREELADLIGDRKGMISLIETAAYLTGSLLDGDYARSTLAIRETSSGEALERIRRTSGAPERAMDDGRASQEMLVDVAGKAILNTFREAGFEVDELSPRIAAGLRGAVRILQDGDLSARFWHWMDRFYYEIYQNWRAAQIPAMERMQKHAATVLGGEQGEGLPDFDWLPRQNPLFTYPNLMQYVRAHPTRLYLWVEPFELADNWSLYPDLLMVSFAQPGILYEKFLAFAGDVANRAAALADPTRLIILRMIRHFGMTNTEIAEYLRISRPTVSIHAKILREAGLIRSHADGRTVKHEIVPSEVRRLFGDLDRLLDLPGEGN